MVLIKYEKCGVFTYMSFLDVRKSIQRTLSRADINLEMSKGFNPHELMYFNDPDSIGISSLSEYAIFCTIDDVKDFKTLYNNKSPEGVKVLKCKRIENKFSFNDYFFCAEYQISFDCDISILSNFDILNEEKMIVEKKQRDTTIMYDIKPMIIAFGIENKNTIKVVLYYGKDRLNPYLFVNYLVNKYKLDDKLVKVKKIKVYSRQGNNELVDVDNIFFEQNKIN